MNIQQIQSFVQLLQPITVEGVYYTYKMGEAHLYGGGMYCERCLSDEDEGNCTCMFFDPEYNSDYTEEMQCQHKKIAATLKIDANELIVAAILVGSYEQANRQIDAGIDPELEQQEIQFLAPLISQYKADADDLMGIGLAMKP